MFDEGAPLVAVPLGCCCDAEFAPKLKGDCVACRFTSPNKLPLPPALVPVGIESAEPLLGAFAPMELKRLPLLGAPAEDVVGACPVEDEAAVLKIFEGGLPAGVVLNVRPEERGGCGVVVPLADLLPPPRF